MTVGGLAVGLWAYERATKDTDIVVPDADEDNDRRLDTALSDLHAEPLPLEAPGAAALGIRWQLDADVQRWKTDGGVLDVMRRPEGAAPYAELRARSEPTEMFGAPTRVASRDDLIAMKLAAARIQDLLDLDALLDPRNSEPARMRLRAFDRDRLRGTDDPAELGEPVDPCEGAIDQLRHVLAATPAGDELEQRVARRGRALRSVGNARVAEVARLPLPAPPAGLARAAAAAGQAAREIDAAEEREFTLLRARESTSRWRRQDRSAVGQQLTRATEHVERLQTQGDQGIDSLRAGLGEIEQWWEQHAAAVVDAIAGRRERYRRERQRVAERAREAPRRPAGYVTGLIGERTEPQREEWDRAARTIEAYAAQHAPGERQLGPSERPDRARRAAWERMARAVRELGIDPPELDKHFRDPGLHIDR